MNHSEPPNCLCGHPWREHHLSCIMNRGGAIEDHNIGICGGVVAQECEWTKLNGYRIRENETECQCEKYVNSIRMDYKER